MDMLQESVSTSDDDGDDNKEAPATSGDDNKEAAVQEGYGSGDGAAGGSAAGGSTAGCVTTITQKVASFCKSEERAIWAMSPTGSIGMSPGGTVYAEEDLEPLQKGKALFLDTQ